MYRSTVCTELLHDVLTTDYESGGFFFLLKQYIRPTLMHTKNLYENGPNPFFFSGPKT